MFCIPLRATRSKIKTYKSLQIERLQAFLFLWPVKMFRNSQTFSESLNSIEVLTETYSNHWLTTCSIIEHLDAILLQG